MITLLTGDNSFAIQRELERCTKEFDGEVERVDGAELRAERLPELLVGTTLFAANRLVIIKNLSENNAAWVMLDDLLKRADAMGEVIFVEASPDKRTKTYKTLHKKAEIKEYNQWSEREAGKAETWVAEEARTMGLELDKKSVQMLVRRCVVPGVRAGGAVIDQWRLWHGLGKLSVLDEVTLATVEDVIETTPAENVFELLNAALAGDAKKVRQMVAALEMTDDPFKTMGLLSGQVFQLAVLSVTNLPSSAVAKDLGVHPYALGKLAPQAKKLGKAGVLKVVEAFTEADHNLKIGVSNPWLLIERALTKCALARRR